MRVTDGQPDVFQNMVFILIMASFILQRQGETRTREEKEEEEEEKGREGADGIGLFLWSFSLFTFELDASKHSRGSHAARS